MKVALHTLGCKVNQYDSDLLLTKLVSAGYEVRNFNQIADIYIVNTCTVTHTGDKKSFQMIRRARRLNPDAFVAVCGCMPHSNEEIGDKIIAAGADFVFDARKPDDLFEKIKLTFTIDVPMTNMINNQRNRAFIKIHDGCNRYCSYCIVPYVRGPVTSRCHTDILTEIETHKQNGILEIVLTGIQVAAYGYDTGSDIVNLPKLINKIYENDNNLRIRISSIDPWAINNEFLSAVANTPTLCSHFHLSLQSGSNTILHNMNRRYTTTDYANVANNLRNLRPNMALTTDIIVGFPGETDEDFEKSIQFAKEMAFAQIHVFEYSPRTGTKAASMSGHISEKLKASRGQKMRDLAANLKSTFLHKQIGKSFPVLFETINQGHTTNYCIVHVKNATQPNIINDIYITGVTDEKLVGISLKEATNK